MGKRFGRNQRRQMRQRIAEQAEALEEHRKVIRQNAAMLAECLASQSRVRDVLGAHFIALPPEVRTLAEREHVLEVPRLSMRETANYSIENVHRQCQATEFQVNALDTHWIEFRGDELLDQMFLGVQTPDGTLGYAVSMQAIVMTPADVLAGQIARVVEGALYHHFSERHAEGVKVKP